MRRMNPHAASDTQRHTPCRAGVFASPTYTRRASAAQLARADLLETYEFMTPARDKQRTVWALVHAASQASSTVHSATRPAVPVQCVRIVNRPAPSRP
jgi:hypothetical protein